MSARSFALIISLACAVAQLMAAGGVSADTTSYTYTVYAPGFSSNLATPLFLDGVMNGTIPGGGSRTFTFAPGTSHSIRVEPYVPGSTGTRYFCASPSITVSSGGTYSFTYRSQYYLTINSPFSKASGDGWKDSGTYAQANLDSGQIQSIPGARHNFIAWGGDASGSGLTSNQILMDGPKIAIANWKTQYLLIIKTDPSGIDSSGGAWYDSGSTAIFSIVSPSGGSPGIRYLFTNWSGNFTGNNPSASIQMDAPKTVLANFKTQYKLLVATSPSGLANVTGSGWHDVGETIALGTAPSLISGGAGKRYVFSGWAVDGSGAAGNPVSVVMNGPRTTVANYKTQFYLSVKSPYGNAQGDGWYDEGTTATFSVEQTHNEGWIKYVFDKWIGDSPATSSTTTIMMDSPKAVVAIYHSDYTTLYLFAGSIAAVGVVGAVLGLKVLPRTGILRRRVGPVEGPPPQGGIPYMPAATVVHTIPEMPTISTPTSLQPTTNVPPISCSSCSEEIPGDAYFCDKCGAKTGEMEQGGEREMDPFEQKLYDYIIAHEGTISVKRAAEELGVTVDQVKDAAERLKRSGRLG